MGLFGGGNSSNTTTVQNTEQTITPQSSLQGAAGSSNFQITPSTSSGSIGAINAQSYNAPIYLTPSTNIGDAAIAAAQATAQAQIASNTPTQPVTSSSSSFDWSTLFAPPYIYYWIAGIVLLMILRGHHKG